MRRALLLVGALVLAARTGRRAGRALPWALVGVLSVASVALGFVVSPVHAYLGTGTRAVALLAGAALALDAPRPDVIADARGAVVAFRGEDGRPRIEPRPVTITRWPPGERVYGR